MVTTKMQCSSTAALAEHQAEQDIVDSETSLLANNMHEHISELWDDERARVMMLMGAEFDANQCAKIATLLALAEQMPFPFKQMALELRASFDDAIESYVMDNPSKFLR